LGWVAALALVLSTNSRSNAQEATDADSPFEMGAFVGGHFFSVNNELGARDVADSPTMDDAFGFGARLGFWLTDFLGVEAEGVVVPTRSSIGSSEQTVFAYRLNAVLQADLGRVKPFALLGAGFMTNSSERDEVLLDDTDFVAHGGLGAKLSMGESWGFRADARLLLPPSSADDGLAVDYEGWLGVYRTLGGKSEPAPDVPPEPVDTDGDGIDDDADACVNEAEDADGFEDTDGCPDPDNDGDGIPDEQDECVDEPETVNDYKDEDGCPDTVPAKGAPRRR
jgi:OOP family OmpA-OmpF porin